MDSTIEGIAIRIYIILARELGEFIEEYKVDVRKPRDWGELDSEAKAYWYRIAEKFLESCQYMWMPWSMG